MRVLGIGDYNDLGSVYMQLAREGHEVRVHIAESGSHDVLAGLVTRTDDWAAELPWVREAGADGLVMFEEVGRGGVQDQLRRDGFHVLGGSAYGDRLEQDRAFGQQTLAGMGLPTLPTRELSSLEDGMALIRREPRRYVLKFNGSDLASDMNYVGVRADGADVISALQRQVLTKDFAADEDLSFVLMDHVTGIETGLGAFFDGNQFVGPINLDWEHKRFFPGDLGELTGEMGTVVTYRGGERLFEATLAKLAPRLREANHVGYINLNTIINDDGIWPLELTCRFGYPGFAILTALFAEPMGPMLGRVARGEGGAIRTHGGYAVGVVLTVPPFPYHHGYDELAKGLPILLDDVDEEDRANLHYGEVALERDTLVTAGQIGYVMVVTGRGEAIADAQRAAYRLAGKVAIPNVRYRNDIGDALKSRGLAELTRLGWL
jgi:phosphoribosylamine--glycine ligase